MTLRVTATNVVQIGAGIWRMEMPPHQVRHFGSSAISKGNRSILMFDDWNFDSAKSELSFDIDDVQALNVGTSAETIGIASDRTELPKPDMVNESKGLGGPGDREFLRLAKQSLSNEMNSAAEQLLAGVRKVSPGDLKRGKSRNFSETPDNFWYVIVQPRIDQLSLTVRGPVSHFEGLTNLEIKDDRGNTRFKVRGISDVSEALKLIFHAHRKH